MSDRKPSRLSDYEVGYCRPPKATQFAPGRSGNPRGRPKARPSVGAILDAIIQQKIAVTENGRKRWIPGIEVILRQLLNQALRNDPKALKLLLSLMDRYVEAPEAKVQLSELLDEDQEILAEYLRPPRKPVGGSAGEAEEDVPEPSEKANREGPDDGD
jgi:hypothetical protein